MPARLALVTTDVPWLLEHEHDLEPLLQELARQGVAAEAAVWTDPAVDWSRYDLIVMRCPWDYSLRLAEFLEWLGSLEPDRVLNPPGLIRWNLDKRYLLDLEAHGVPIVPTKIASSLAEVRIAAETIGGRIVIKPNVGAGSFGAHLTSADDPKLDSYAAELLDAGKLVLVEPEIPEITAGGERGLLFFDGEYSHTITKGRILGEDGGYHGGEYNEDISAVTPTDAEVEVAAQCSRAIAAIATERGFSVGEGATPLYARYDIVTGASGPMVIEAELLEPSYFVATAAGSVERVVGAMVRRLEVLRR
jgi:glutathione synthase/RimK-type ligase-like ATP-grasp enzyme